MEKVITFKAFDADFACRGFQYDVGRTYKTNNVENGFKIYPNPWDIFEDWRPNAQPSKRARFLEPVKLTRYALVEIEMDEGEGDAPQTIKIIQELSLAEFFGQMVSFSCSTLPQTDANRTALSGTKRTLAQKQNYSFVSFTGDHNRLALLGHDCQISGSGDSGIFGISGNRAQVALSGNWNKFAVNGAFSQIAVAGDGDIFAVHGDNNKIAVSGRWSIVQITGAASSIVSVGRETRFSGSVGTKFSIAEWQKKDGVWFIAGFVNGLIGEDGLEPGVFYIVRHRKIVPADIMAGGHHV